MSAVQHDLHRPEILGRGRVLPCEDLAVSEAADVLPAQFVRPGEIADRDAPVVETYPVAACPVKQQDSPERGDGVGSDNRDPRRPQEDGDKRANDERNYHVENKAGPAADGDRRWPGWP